MFPTNGSVTRPLPSLLAGFLGFGFPTFHRYYEGAKTSRVHPARSVSFAWRYHSLRSGVSLSWMPGAPSTSLGLVRPDGPCRRLGAEINGISQVPTLLVNAILISENRSPFSEKHYKLHSFVGQDSFLLSDHALIWVVPSPVHSAILGFSSKLIRQPRDGPAVLQGGA